jgi:hypothetical protein
MASSSTECDTPKAKEAKKLHMSPTTSKTTTTTAAGPPSTPIVNTKGVILSIANRIHIVYPPTLEQTGLRVRNLTEQQAEGLGRPEFGLVATMTEADELVVSPTGATHEREFYWMTKDEIDYEAQRLRANEESAQFLLGLAMYHVSRVDPSRTNPESSWRMLQGEFKDKDDNRLGCTTRIALKFFRGFPRDLGPIESGDRIIFLAFKLKRELSTNNKEYVSIMCPNLDSEATIKLTDARKNNVYLFCIN